MHYTAYTLLLKITLFVYISMSNLKTKTINLLFVHPNFPGQFKELLNSLSKHVNVRLAFITAHQTAEMDKVDIRRYQQTKPEPEGMIHYLGTLNQNLFDTQEVTKQAIELARSGFKPDAVIGHIGWCGLLFMKDVFPEAKLIGYTEWYYRWQNSWEYFSDKKAPMNLKAKVRMLNASSIIGLESLDVSVTPTHWQRSVFPQIHQRNMHVIHEGIDTQVCCPKPRSELKVPGCNLNKDAKIITYIARSMEPARGFFSYMAAVEKLCKLDSELQFVVVGRPRPAYSSGTGDGPSYKQQALEKYDCDWSRVHFCGKLPYDDYLQVLRNTSVHIHLSMPLFLSWSLLEAMACGCTIIGSSNAPVNEVIKEDINGRLVPFFDTQALVDQALELLKDTDAAKRLGVAARQTVLDNYEVSQCTDKWKSLILRTAKDNYPKIH